MLRSLLTCMQAYCLQVYLSIGVIDGKENLCLCWEKLTEKPLV